MSNQAAFSRNIHLLYVPTLGCNLSCSYCYLGRQTTDAKIAEDAARAVATLDVALARLEAAGVLAFNVSLHGGEVSTMPPVVLEGLLTRIQQHYLHHFDAISALGHKKAVPHIKTNLYKFASLYELYDRHKVSISASIDLPLALHAEHRRTRAGHSWLERTHEHLRLLGRYPHAKKLSTTISAEHLADIPAFIRDIWFIHRELGFDMNQFNLMFAFPSALNAEAKGEASLTTTSQTQQLQLYAALHQEFLGTELEDGLRRNWFDEFKPSYCTNALNCGERFYLLQSDGEVYSCVRGQGIEAFHYGNLLQDPVLDVLERGARQISQIHQQMGFDGRCRACDHLTLCHTGCPVVKYQQQQGYSYTCALQQAIYRDYPLSYPGAPNAEQKQQGCLDYALAMHPALVVSGEIPDRPSVPAFRLPSDMPEEKNTLDALIAADPVLQMLYSPDVFVLELDGERIALESQILKPHSVCYTVQEGESILLHLRRDLLLVACPEPIRNTVYVQMLRDTPVVYGDEQRSKQAHLFTYQCFADGLLPSHLGADWLQLDLTGIVALHRHLYQRGVRNNLFFTTQYLRDYHYQKQKNNAFYHIQAVNLPFQNIEFFYLLLGETAR